MSTTAPVIRRILVPHDFSETAQHALAYALDLAEKLGASVTLMHAYEVPSFGFPDGPQMSVEMLGTIERMSRDALANIASRTRRPGVEVTPVLRQGVAWTEIGELAKEIDAGLIVMGTHGRRGFARMMMGSVAERVVRTAPCPVLTVHGPANAS